MNIKCQIVMSFADMLGVGSTLAECDIDWGPATIFIVFVTLSSRAVCAFAYWMAVTGRSDQYRTTWLS